MLQDVLRRERSDLRSSTIRFPGGMKGVGIIVTHVLSITLEDLPKYVDKLVILCEAPVPLHLECLVGLPDENGV